MLPLRSVLVFSLLFLPVSFVKAANDLAGEIEEVIHRPDYKQARWSILVVDAESGKTVYELNADRLMTPASTTKLYSCAAALGILGAEYQFETPVYQRGVVKDGRLTGDLILVAKGDLTLGGRNDGQGKMAFKNHDHIYANFTAGTELTDTDPLAGLKALAKQVVQGGIKQVTGEILVDDRLFPKNRSSGSGPDLVTPIVVNDNVVDILVTPGEKEGEPAKWQIRPGTDFLQIDVQIETVAAGKKPQVQILGVGSQRCLVRGRIPLKSKPLVLIYPVDDPSRFARALFMEALRAEGVRLTASPLQAPQAELPDKAGYDRFQRVAVFTSPPVSELIKVTLKVSHNLYASTLPILAAVHQRKSTLADGLRLQRQFLVDLGLPVDTISFAGGAGGANADATTARATVQLLRTLAKRPDYPHFEAGLPILGVDGTLADTVPGDSPAKGKVRGKTGTLLWQDVMNDRLLLRSKALAGTMTTASGKNLVIALFVNDVPLPKGVEPTREGKVLGKLCEIIYQYAP